MTKPYLDFRHGDATLPKPCRAFTAIGKSGWVVLTFLDGERRRVWVRRGDILPFLVRTFHAPKHGTTAKIVPIP